MPESQRDLRRKRRIIGEIQQITRAMKLVSAAKLKRTVTRREAGQLYWDQLRETLEVVGRRVEGEVHHPYLEQREVKRIGLLIIGGDKGLCGAFNSSIVAAAADRVRASDRPAEVMTMGGRTADIARRAGLRLTRQFPAIDAKQAWQDAVPISRHLQDLYKAGRVDRMYIAYAKFVSRVSHEPTVEILLPLQAPQPTQTWDRRYIFEPKSVELFARLLPRYVYAHVYRLLLDSAASEHSARLMAMTAATDNADDMIEQLTRQINRVRQQEITRELLDVVAGADALARDM